MGFEANGMETQWFIIILVFDNIFPARTPLAFLQLYDALGVVFPTDVIRYGGEHSQRNIAHGIETFRAIINKQFSFLSTICLLDSQFKSYPASMIACSILYLARKKLGLESWPQLLEENTKQDINECQEIIKQLEIIGNDFTSHLTPAFSAMTMTISPVKIPSPTSSYRTPTQTRPIRITTSDEEQKFVDDEENLHPFQKFGRGQSDTSPYSVAVVPSPLV